MKLEAETSLGMGLSSLEWGLVLAFGSTGTSVFCGATALLRSDNTVTPSLQALCSVCAFKNYKLKLHSAALKTEIVET